MTENMVRIVTKNGAPIAVFRDFDKASEYYKSLRYQALQKALDKLVEKFHDNDVTNYLIKELVSVETNTSNPYDELSDPIYDIVSFEIDQELKEK